MSTAKSQVLANTRATARLVSTDTVKHTQKPSLVARFKTNIKSRSEQTIDVFNDLKLKLTTHKKPATLSKRAAIERRKALRAQVTRGILGLGLLFVVVSIAYSSYVIYNGVHSTASRVMLIPQVVFAVFSLAKAFSKIYK